MAELILNLSMLGAKPTGLGVYSEHSARALAERFEVSIIAGQGFRPNGKVIVEAPPSVAIGGGKLAAIRRQVWMRSLRFDPKATVYSPTHHGLPGRDNQIITIHDLICLRFPSQHRPQYLFFRYALPSLLRRCKAVFTVSETTKEDVAETYKYPREKIFVVPNGVDTRSFSADAGARGCDPYLLMVGARYSHKNVDEVLKQSAVWAPKYRLKITSCGGEYRKELEAEVAARGLQSRVEFLDYLGWEQLLRLYQGCAALLYPSKWEGFGIPPLEAFACGNPVIASDIPVHREVLGKAAIFVRLGDGESWRTAFVALENQAIIDACGLEAQRVLQRFTWENSARMLEEALLQVDPGFSALRRKNAGV